MKLQLPKRDVMREMERLADSGSVSVRTGIRSLEMGKSVLGEEEERLEIVLAEYCSWDTDPRLEDLMSPGGLREEEFQFQWTEVSNAYAVLSPMQVAFLHPEKIHRHTALDDELFHACDVVDEAGIRAALEKGANIHALTKGGYGVCGELIGRFDLWWGQWRHHPDDPPHHPELAERLLRLLLAHGADLDLAGAGGETALVIARGCASWMMELLLRFGAARTNPAESVRLIAAKSRSRWMA